MGRPKRDTHEIYVRLSDEAFAAFGARADEIGMTASELVGQVIDRYLDRILDGQLPLQMFAMPAQLRMRKFTIEGAVGRRMERVRARTGFGPQDIGRAAVTDFLHVL